MPTTTPTLERETSFADATPYELLASPKRYFMRESDKHRVKHISEESIRVDPGDSSGMYFEVLRLHPEATISTKTLQKDLISADVESKSAKDIPENVARKIHTYDKIATVLRDAQIEQYYVDEDFDAMELFD